MGKTMNTMATKLASSSTSVRGSPIPQLWGKERYASKNDRWAQAALYFSSNDARQEIRRVGRHARDGVTGWGQVLNIELGGRKRVRWRDRCGLNSRAPCTMRRIADFARPHHSSVSKIIKE